MAVLSPRRGGMAVAGSIRISHDVAAEAGTAGASAGPISQASRSSDTTPACAHTWCCHPLRCWE